MHQHPGTVLNTCRSVQGSRLSVLPMAREWRWVRVALAHSADPLPASTASAAVFTGAEFEVGGQNCIELNSHPGEKGSVTERRWDHAEQFRTALWWQGLPVGWGESFGKPLEPPRPPTAYRNLRWPPSRPFYLITIPYNLSKNHKPSINSHKPYKL